ncbi:MAG: TIM barrel protein [Acidobacteria bacterium]|nr:TIM barrel protein [Acidobacteriota bacterium]MBI3427623.1 TIM barrel protein [Acidobacteriota bacterium]
MRIGNAPVSWGIMEIEGWGGQQAYGAMLDELVKAGYTGTELGPYGYFPTEPAALRHEMATRNLNLVTAFVPIPLADLSAHEAGFEEALKTAKLLAAAGARSMLLADAMSKERMSIAGRADAVRDGLTDAQWEHAAAIVMRVAQACRELGLAVSFHHHAGTYIETPAEIARLLESTDAALLGLCLDTGHYFYGGGDPLTAVQQYGPRIRHLHLKDVQPAVLDAVRRDGVDFLAAVRRGVFCELGQGAIPFPQIIQGLQASGYDGWAIVEQDTDVSQPGVEPYASAVRSRQYLREVIGI